MLPTLSKREIVVVATFNLSYTSVFNLLTSKTEKKKNSDQNAYADVKMSLLDCLPDDKI